MALKFTSRILSSRLSTVRPSLFGAALASKRSNYVDVKNFKPMKPKRPMSPFMLGTHYKFQLSSLMSLGHRMTGCTMTVAVWGAGLICLVNSGDFTFAIDILKSLPAVVKAAVQFGVTFPLPYHALNGLRHLQWDTERGLDLKTLYKTGYFVAGSATLLTLLILAFV
eukprot:TRINITY_DN9140_c0_g1_i1.p2 TRINITY_DN9140_c0_g1~~TRINITY_DN9140_c0_g1_i1.p2  ORF type:complete len:167 (-),score=71.83 TRINITY_DN9140_c0_g1_i1:119-619(-)